MKSKTNDYGIVYVLTNPGMPGLVKIGKTIRTLEERLSELNNTSVPDSFKCEYECHVFIEECAKVEKEVHDAFSIYRVNPDREFFRIDAEKIIAFLKLYDKTEEIIRKRNEEPEKEFQNTRPKAIIEKMGEPGVKENGKRIYNTFLFHFPPKRLLSLTLEEYIYSSKDSFCYWIGEKTRDLGYINDQPDPVYRFGISRHKKRPGIKHRPGCSTDGVYEWMDKYGNSAQEAFLKIRSLLIEIQQAAAGDYKAIDAIDLEDSYKWKTAFHYSNKKLISIFLPKYLRAAAACLGMKNVDSCPISKIQRYLQSKQDDDIFVFSLDIEMAGISYNR